VVKILSTKNPTWHVTPEDGTQLPKQVGAAKRNNDTYFVSYLSSTNGSRSEFQIAALSVLFVMFQAKLSFVLKMLNVFRTCLRNFPLTVLLLCRWLKVITGLIMHFTFYILFISAHKLLYFNFLSASL
jgi:hypothetical protein